MSRTISMNGRIPTDPTQALAVLLTILWAASQLTTEQAQALISAGLIAEVALLGFQLLRQIGRR